MDDKKLRFNKHMLLSALSNAVGQAVNIDYCVSVETRFLNHMFINEIDACEEWLNDAKSRLAELRLLYVEITEHEYIKERRHD